MTGTQAAAALLQMERWDASADTFESWLERFEMQIELLEITDAGKQAKALLSVIGPSGYEMVKNLCTPKKPKDESYANIVKLLTEFVKPQPVELVKRYSLINCVRMSRKM